MAYISTRGHGAPVDLQDLLVRGTAEDGGLYVTEDWPTLSSSALSALARKSYSEIASGLLELFGGENWKTGGFSEGIRQSLDNFAVPEGPPLVKLDEKLWALELFHGPTFAFKDYALVPLAQTIEHKLHLEDGQATVLCATSGDTGAATAAAFAGRPRLRAVILFPENRISEVQRRQMTTLRADNVLALSVKGDFDDCQRLVKQLYQSEKAKEYGYTAVNSINLVRILLQTSYYVYCAYKIQRETRESANIIVPTGNFGNVFAGYIAKTLGAPIDTLVVTSNENDILPRLFDSGRMQKQQTRPTISPSMDIQVSSNFERMLWLLKDRDGNATRAAQHEFETTGCYDLSDSDVASLRQSFHALRCDREQALETIGWAYQNFQREICPHSATAYFATRMLGDRLSGPIIVAETAHAAKFPYPVSIAIGNGPGAPDGIVNVFFGFEKYVSVDATVESVQSAIDAGFN